MANSVKLVRVLDHKWPITVVCLVEVDDDMLLGNSFKVDDFRFRFLNYLREARGGTFKIVRKGPKLFRLNPPYYIRAGLIEDTLRSRAALLRTINDAV